MAKKKHKQKDADMRYMHNAIMKTINSNYCPDDYVDVEAERIKLRIDLILEDIQRDLSLMRILAWIVFFGLISFLIKILIFN
jgi:hypothetical protein